MKFATYLRTVVTLIVVLFIASSCQTKEDAKVQQIQGLYVFILSKPVKNYEALDVINKNALDEYRKSVKNKKAGDVIKDIFNTTLENVDMQNLLNEMVSMAREKHPDADGIVFENRLSQGTVIKFTDNY